MRSYLEAVGVESVWQTDGLNELRIVSQLLTNDKEGHKLVKQVAATPPSDHEGRQVLRSELCAEMRNFVQDWSASLAKTC